MVLADRNSLEKTLDGWSEIVVDASLCGCALFARDGREIQAEAFLRQTITMGIRLVAPVLFAWEMDTTLRQFVQRGEVAEADIPIALRAIDTLPVALIYDRSELESARLRAREIAHLLGQPGIYDALYAALAEARNAPFWTFDKRFANACQQTRHQPDGTTGPTLPHVFFLGNY